MTEREQIEQAIAHMEGQRTILGDAVVDASIAALREKLAALASAEAPTPPFRQAQDIELRGERKLVTILFADISGFTALAETMDPEAVRDLMNACFERLVPVVEKYEGTVDKFIGDEVMTLFGAPTTHENDPERALRAALEMRDALTEFNAGRGTDLGIHFGINTGHVIAGGIGTRGRQEYSVIGDAVNLASRLEEVSERGEILVGPDTHRLTRPLFEFEALEPVRVKGKAEPVPVYRLLASRAVRGRVRGIAGLESPLVGRQTEFCALQEAVERHRAGVGGIVTLVGEAGLGKSRLMAELRQIADRGSQTPGVQWVEGRCLSYGTSIAYLAWLDVLRGLLGVTAEDSPVAVRDALRERVHSLCPDRLESVHPYLCRLMSLPMEAEAETKLGGLDGESLKFATFRAVENMIESTARQGPLILVCEDLHWADPTSLELLKQLLALTDRGSPLLLICVFRPEMEHGCWRIKETAARIYRGRHIDLWLDPLSTAESETLVGNLLHVEDLPQELSGRVLSHAEGNPFFVEEIIRSLMDSGAIARDDITGRWEATQHVDDIAVPDTLHGVLMARIDRLQEETKRVLQLAAVIGRIFVYRILAAIAQEERELDAHLLTLQREQMIRKRAEVPELEYIFKHYLTQEAAYNGLLKKERRVYHRQVAEALERLFPDRVEEQLGLLAHHWERAGETRRAISYLRRAGEQAEAQFANDEAMDYLSRALDLTPEDNLAERYALLLTRERVYDVQGEREAQRQDLATLEGLAEALVDDEQQAARRRAEVALRLANYAEVTGDYPATCAAAQVAISLAQAAHDVSSEAAGYLQWGRALWRQGEYEAARTQLEGALTLAQAAQPSAGVRRRGSSEAHVQVSVEPLQQVEAGSLRSLGIVSFLLGDYAGAWAYLEQALRVFRHNGDRRGESAVFNNLGVVSAEQGDYARARAYFEQVLCIYREIGDRQGEGRTLNNLGIVSGKQGDYAGTRAYLNQALRIYREIGDRHGEGGTLSNLGEVSDTLGDYAGAMAYFEQALSIYREIGDRQVEGQVAAHLGLLSHHLGDNQAAREYSQQALLTAQDIGDRRIQGYALTYLGHALAGLGQLTEAADAYRHGLALRGELGQPKRAIETLAGLARVSLIQGDLGQARAQVEEILSHLETKTLEGTDEPFRVYLTCYRVQRANEDPRAREILHTAHRLLQERAAKIDDEELRRSFVENVAAHQDIVEEWGKPTKGCAQTANDE